MPGEAGEGWREEVVGQSRTQRVLGVTIFLSFLLPNSTLQDSIILGTKTSLSKRNEYAGVQGRCLSAIGHHPL